jgi:hypothetical protein
VAKIIVYLEEGHPITPPLIAVRNNNEFLICGGHHRYAVIKASGFNGAFPIYMRPEDFEAVSNLISFQEDKS